MAIKTKPVSKLKTKEVTPKIKFSKKKSVTILVVSVLLLVIAVAAYSIYSSTVTGGSTAYGTTLKDGEIPGALKTGTEVTATSEDIEAASQAAGSDIMAILPETGTRNQTSTMVGTGVSLLVNQGTCDPSQVKNFWILQNLAGYVYRYLSVGFAVFKTTYFTYPANFGKWQGASGSYGLVPRSYFTSYTMKTQNYIYYFDKNGTQVFLDMVLSNPIGYSYSDNFTNTYSSITVNCKGNGTITNVPGRTNTPTPTFTPTPLPTCVPSCRKI